MLSNCDAQLVSSATSDPKTDAFNFLSQGAGAKIFEIILKVRSVFPHHPSILTLQKALHRLALRYDRLFPWQSSSRFKVDVSVERIDFWHPLMFI